MEAPVEPEKKETEITSITKSSPAKETKPYSRLENFYKFMDNIEEETQSQLDQSESRRESKIPDDIMPSAKHTPIKSEIKDVQAPRKVDNKTSTAVDDVMQNLTKQLAVESGDTIATNDKYAIRQKMMELEIEKEE